MLKRVMEELYEIIYGKIDAPLYIPVATLGALPVGRIFRIPNLYKIKDLKPSEISFKVVQTSQPRQINDKLVTKVNVEVIKDIKEKDKACYVCGADLSEFYKIDMDKQDGLNSPPKIPQMIKWNGVREAVCPDCYKASVTGLQVYQERHPDWKPPQ